MRATLTRELAIDFTVRLPVWRKCMGSCDLFNYRSESALRSLRGTSTG